MRNDCLEPVMICCHGGKSKDKVYSLWFWYLAIGNV